MPSMKAFVRSNKSISVWVFNTFFPVSCHIITHNLIYGLIYGSISLNVWVVTNIRWRFHANSPFRNIFTEKMMMCSILTLLTVLCKHEWYKFSHQFLHTAENGGHVTRGRATTFLSLLQKSVQGEKKKSNSPLQMLSCTSEFPRLLAVLKLLRVLLDNSCLI